MQNKNKPKRNEGLYPSWYPTTLVIKKPKPLLTFWNSLCNPISAKAFSLVLLCLLIFGWVMVHSASISYSSSLMGLSSIAAKQLLYILLGAAVGFVVVSTPVDKLRELTLPILAVSLFCLALVQVPGLGKSVNGAQRWIGLGPFNFQPAELAKMAIIMYCADYCIRRQVRLKTEILMSFIPLIVVLMLLAFLLLLQPDFGSLVVISISLIGILLMGGMSLGLFSGMLVVLGSFVTVLVLTSPYRMARLTAFLDPWADPYGKGYQLTHSLMAFGRGGITGQGLGGSIEKLKYLPEAHTDFILAIVSEELGFIGFLVVLATYYFIVFQCFRLGRKAFKLDMPYAGLLAKGVGLWLGFQCIINSGVNVGLFPTKGLTLPLMSYGGSSLIINMAMLALVVRVALEVQGKEAQSNREVFNVFSLNWESLKDSKLFSKKYLRPVRNSDL